MFSLSCAREGQSLLQSSQPLLLQHHRKHRETTADSGRPRSEHSEVLLSTSTPTALTHLTAAGASLTPGLSAVSKVCWQGQVLRRRWQKDRRTGLPVTEAG